MSLSPEQPHAGDAVTSDRQSTASPENTESGAVSRATAAFLIAVSALAAVVAVGSLGWRMKVDAPLLHYMAFMVDVQDAVLYRDLFVTTFPGAILFHLAMLKTVGPSNLAFMATNLAWIIALGAVTWALLRPFGKRVALGGPVLFALAYLQSGAIMVLERDLILILPVAGAVLIHARARWSSDKRAFWIGFLFALACTFKPHSGIGLPAVLVCEWLRDRDSGIAITAASIWRKFLYAGLGFAIPIVAVFGWLASTGGMPAFLDILGNYLPLHVRLTRFHEYMEGTERLDYYVKMASQFGLGSGFGHPFGLGQPGWLLASVVGTIAILAKGGLDAPRRRLVLLFVTLAVLYWVYVVMAGQFWEYHWMPFRYAIVVLASLCLARMPGLAGGGVRAWSPLAALVLSFVIVVPLSRETIRQFKGKGPTPPRDLQAEVIAEYLVERLEPGDTVQPLDWTMGGIHAMLLAEARIATAFPSDYHFYHHLHKPYIQSLRERFIADLRKASPRFILEMTDRPMPFGDHTAKTFPKQSELLATEYFEAKRGSGWIVYERRK